MTVSDDANSRRTFLDKTTKTGLVVYALRPWTRASAAPSRRTVQSKADAGASGPHRYIDQSLCIGCGRCLHLCPMEAISLGAETSSIDPKECAECGTCSRAQICPVDAITPVKLEWPRVLRETFSNPRAVHENTGITGRGTEGIKTNDSQNRYRRGEMGVFIEVGRPVLGGRFDDVERIVKKFRDHGYQVIPQNPIASLIAKPETGALKREILDEKIISCVIEFLLPTEAADELIAMVEELADEVESLFSLSVGLRAGEEGEPHFKEVFGPDIVRLPNAKVNLGISQQIVGGEV